MKLQIPQKCIRYCLMAAICYFMFEKYNIKYNLENCLLASLSCIVLNKLIKKTGIEGFEDGESEEQAQEESPDQEESPEIVEEITEEISVEDESQSEEEPVQEEPVQEEQAQEEQEEQAQEEPVQEEPVQEEPVQEVQEEPVQEEEKSKEEDKDEIKPYSSEELQKLQKKYTIMPVESWIKNEINLMKKSQETKSCACPTLSRASNNYLEF